MKKQNLLLSFGALFLVLGLLAGGTGCRTASIGPSSAEAWRGLHVPVFGTNQLDTLEKELPKLAELGVNVVTVQVDYHFDFKSHPELRDKDFITKAQARKFTAEAHKLGMCVIPELDCLGHQSLHTDTLPLLAKYPQFDETPGQYPGNKGIYCRSWCPQNPGVHPIIFALIDELADAFKADAFNVGLDEVFIIADDHCPLCHGQNPAKLFALEVNTLHQHIVAGKGWTMLMWADRLLDAKTMGYGRYESAINGTAGAVDLIPKDIILCDWHYRAQTNYPSVPYLLDKGFRVWPSGFQPLEGAKALSQFSMEQRRQNPGLIGYMATTWSQSRKVDLSTWPPVADVMPAWKQ